MLNERSKQVRRDTIKLSKANGGYHYGGSFSCVEILIALFDHVLTDKDKFILSKGHACWPYYVLLREKGFNPGLEGHPKRDEHNGIHCSTGSLGHGFPMSVGMAMAKKIKGEEGKVYVLMGDGECQEGTTWESLLIARQHKLDNLMVIVDCNGLQGSGRVSKVLHINDFIGVLGSIDWRRSMINGHSVDKIVNSIQETYSRFPKMILANTIKGKGVSFMENKPEWHSKWLDGDLEKQAMRDLE